MEADKPTAWITLTEAAAKYGVVKSTISRIAQKNNIPTRKDTIDNRIMLIDKDRLAELMNSSVKYKQE